MFRAIRIVGFSLAVLLQVPLVAHAEPIDPATLLPEKTLLYIAHYGSEQTDEACKKTALGKMLADPQFDRMINSIDAAIDVAAKQHLEKEEAMLLYKTLRRVLSLAWRRPVALTVIDGGYGEQGPVLQAALIVHAGKDAKPFLSDVNTLLAANESIRTQPMNVGGYELRHVIVPVPGGVYFGLMDEYFVAAVGDKTVEAIAAHLKGKEKSSLATATPFTLARKKIGGSPANRICTFYADVAGIIERAQTTMANFSNKDDAKAKIDVALEMSGMGRIHAICYEQFYHERGCCGGLYLLNKKGMQEGHEKDSPPVEIKDDQIAQIPQDATWAAITQIDWSDRCKTIMSALQKTNPKVHTEATEHIKKLESVLGFCVDDDFLAKLGSSLVIYDSPQAGGLLFAGATAIFEPNDPEKVETNLGKMVAQLAKHLGGRHLDIRTLEHQGATIHFANPIGAPIPVAPAWAVKGKHFIFALYPQMVEAALDRLADKKIRDTSLLRNNDFLSARKVLGRIGSSVTYVDTKAAFECAYDFLLPLAQTGVAAGQGEGIKLDIAALPTKQVFTQNLFPDVSVERSDDAGTLSLSYGPLPFSIGPANLYAVGPLGVSVVLPALSRARELSKRTVCAMDMRDIGKAMFIHAQDHNEKFPDTFQELVDENNITPRQFLCPSVNAEISDLKSSYKYIRGLGPKDGPRMVVLYEKRSNHGPEGGNILFADGHVEFIAPYAKVEQLVKATKKKLDAREKQGAASKE